MSLNEHVATEPQNGLPVAPPVIQMLPANNSLPAAAHIPAQQRPAATSEAINADDLVWVNRARAIVAETRGDPHRQVQLLQHLRTQYQKQRLGRDPHRGGVV